MPIQTILECELADTWRKKYLGLMFRKECTQPLMFLFDSSMHVPLHMFFVKFPIDVLYLDENDVVVEMILNFKPWKYYEPLNKCKRLIELPAGQIKSYDFWIGDKLDIEILKSAALIKL